jgi:hypothetical protein
MSRYTAIAACLLLAFFPACAPRTISSLSESRLLALLPNEIPNEFESDAGCYFSAAGNTDFGYVLGWNIDRSPWIGLQSGPLKLEMIKDDMPYELNQTATSILKGPNIAITLTMTSPASCPNEEDCASDNMLGTLDVRIGTEREILNVNGACGC